MKLTRLAIAAVLALAACTPATPSPTPESTPPPALWVENRGGPAVTLEIAGTPVATVACDSGAELVPGQSGVPTLPWDLRILRLRDGALLLQVHVTDLPRWFVQIGENPEDGLSGAPIAGPPGPSCPPAS
jgi:hypothetical protein